MEFENDYRPKGREDLLKRDLDDGCVLYDEKTSQVYTLNTTAALIWEYCDGNTTIEEIAEEIASAGNLNKDEAIKDVQKTIADFNEKALLHIAG
jgi:hypothetical protein